MTQSEPVHQLADAGDENSQANANRRKPQVAKNALAATGLAALGIVFGDIGTSPLYTLKTTPGDFGGPPDRGRRRRQPASPRVARRSTRATCSSTPASATAPPMDEPRSGSSSKDGETPRVETPAALFATSMDLGGGSRRGRSR